MRRLVAKRFELSERMAEIKRLSDIGFINAAVAESEQKKIAAIYLKIHSKVERLEMIASNPHFA